MDASIDISALGIAAIPEARLTELVSRQVGADDVRVESATASVVDYPIGTPSTYALLRVAGTATAEDRPSPMPWSFFVKVLQSAWQWPYLHEIPEGMRSDFAREFPWRLEVDAHASRVRDVLPAGFRMPRLYEIDEIDDHHAALWTEDVHPCPAVWDLTRFTRAARLLGELAGRRPPDTPHVFGSPDHVRIPGFALRMYTLGRVLISAAGMIAADRLWQHPTLVSALQSTREHHLRGALAAALDRVDPWLALLGSLPHTYVHGDASPQNLLVPAGDPESFVIIDWGFNSPHAVGFDLGQLLIGLAHAGDLDPDDLPRVHDAIVPAYVDGLSSAADGIRGTQVRQGFVASLLLRSLFTALPLELLTDAPQPDLQPLLEQRIRLTRFMLDLGHDLPGIWDLDPRPAGDPGRWLVSPPGRDHPQ